MRPVTAGWAFSDDTVGTHQTGKLTSEKDKRWSEHGRVPRARLD